MDSDGAVRERITERREARRAEAASAARAERRTAAAAFAAILGGLAGILASVEDWWPVAWWWPAVAGLALTIVLVGRRDAATRRRRRAGFAIDWLERALARLDDRWKAGQEDGREFLDPGHLFAGDLDLFGEDSLFDRLNATCTPLGRDALARILAGGPPPAGLGARQDAVRELARDPEFRERLEIALREYRGRGGRSTVERARLDEQTRALLDWGATATPPPESRLRVTAVTVLGALATASIAAVFVFDLEWGIVIPFYLLNFVVLGRAKGVSEVLERFEAVDETLDDWSRILACVEAAPHRAPLLASLRAPLLAGGRPASAAIRRLHVLIERLSRRRNVFWTLTFDVLWLYDLHALRRLHAWKRDHGTRLRGWLEAAAGYEAFAALAAYAEACPADAWPVEDAAGPLFDARGLAHALLPRSTRVGNDLAVSGTGEILLVTGSNMSGKSTLLRAAGLAAVMAHAGLPVAAFTIRLRPLALATCMRVMDSVAKGSSRFHAEVLRLKACVDAASDPALPTLILLDEILSGTNSTERHAGTVAVLRMLSTRPAATLVATHDLALVSLSSEFPGRVRVAHFRDLIADHRMVFDYVLRDGPCPTTNALRVMRAAGFDIGGDS